MGFEGEYVEEGGGEGGLIRKGGRGRKGFRGGGLGDGGVGE